MIIIEAEIRRGIFQGDSLSQLLFAIVIMPLSNILRKCTDGYKLSKFQKILNCLAKNEKELET